MAMARDPETAKYDSMPRSAIETGLADYVLPPEKMGEHLIEYAKRGTPEWPLGPFTKIAKQLMRCKKSISSSEPKQAMTFPL